MGLFGNLFSVKSKAIKYYENIDKAQIEASLLGNSKKLAKLEAEYDKWYDSLSETDKKKADDARTEWKNKQSEKTQNALKEAMGEFCQEFDDSVNSLLEELEEEEEEE